MRRFSPFVLACAFTVASAADCRAENGVSATEMKIGSNGALTGPNGIYSTHMSAGANALFAKLNAAGGIGGRNISLITLDDKYEPELATQNVQKLVDGEKVFFMFGGNGTPSVKAMTPFLKKTDTPLLFPYTGAEITRVPVDRNLFNIRISYGEEADSLVNLAVKELGIKEIGVFHQDDAFGVSGKSGVQKALAGLGLTLKASASHKRNTEEVDAAVNELMKAGVKAVYMQSNKGPSAAFIKKAAAKGFRPVYLGSSPVGTLGLLDLLKEIDADIYMAEVMPIPTDTSYPFVRDYQADMKAAGNEDKISGISLEGYYDALVTAEVLKRMGSDLTRDKLRSTIESMRDENIGGLQLSFSPTNHQGLSKGFIYHIKGGRVTNLKKPS